jgi:inosose dehydratase
MSAVRVASAPLCYGAFEMTVGSEFAVEDPGDVVAAMPRAGFRGTDLGPPGYLGERETLAARLGDHGLEGLRRTLDLFEAAAAPSARPVLADAGGPERFADPGRAGRYLSWDCASAAGDFWSTAPSGPAMSPGRAASSPSFTTTPPPTWKRPPRSSACWPTPKSRGCLTTATLPSPVQTPASRWRDWRDRVELVHLKDVCTDVLQTLLAEGAGMMTAWRRRVFCPLGDGSLDLQGRCRELDTSGYVGLIVIEQDRVLERDSCFSQAVEDQVANRAGLAEYAGW